MNHRRTFHGLGDPGRHRAGGSARPRALRRHRRRGHVRDRAGHAGSRRPGLRAATPGRPPCWPSWPRWARTCTRDTTPPTWARPTPWWCPARSGPATRSWPRRATAACGCCPGPPRWPRSCAAAGPTAVAGTHGKTTTTSMLTVDPAASAGADPSYVIGGELAETGRGADDGGRRRLRRGGRRERRVVPHAVAARGGGDQRRGRPPGQLRRAGARSGPRSRPSRDRIDPGGAPGRLRRRPGRPGGGRGVPGPGTCRVRSYGEAADADYRVARVHPARAWARTFVLTAATGSRAVSRARSRLAVPGRHNVLNAAAAFAAGRRAGVSGRAGRGGAGRLPRARSRRLEPKGEADGVRVLRQLRPPPDRGRRRPGGRPGPWPSGGTGRGGVPAAPVQPDPDLRGRARRRAGPGRRGGRAGHLAGPGGPEPGGHRRAGGRRGPARRGVTSEPGPLDAVPARVADAGRARVTWSSPWAPAT